MIIILKINKKINKKKYKNCAICTLTKESSAKKKNKKNKQHSNQFIKIK